MIMKQLESKLKSERCNVDTITLLKLKSFFGVKLQNTFFAIKFFGLFENQRIRLDRLMELLNSSLKNAVRCNVDEYIVMTARAALE